MSSRWVAWIVATALAVGPIGAAGADAGVGQAAGGWQAVLAAGDDAQPVFDDATGAMLRFLAEAGIPAANIRRLSASAGELGPNVGRAVKSLLLQRVAALPVRPGDRCLVFLTSHGVRGAGLYLAPLDETLRPEELAQALSQDCAAAPTVVIVSGCFTGAFAAAPMARPNRIILTAARADRPSFGCQAGRTYTFFDGCLLAALPKSATWQAVFDDTSGCVRRLEHRLKARPSEPQAYFGAAVRDLPVPPRRAG